MVRATDSPPEAGGESVVAILPHSSLALLYRLLAAQRRGRIQHDFPIRRTQPMNQLKESFEIHAMVRLADLTALLRSGVDFLQAEQET